MRTGRPTIRTDEIVEEILDRLTDGEPLAQILRSPGMPRPSTWYDWCAADADLSGRVARAREHGADAIAADALRIADTPVEGVIEKLEPVAVPDPDAPGGSRIELKVTERRVEDMLGHRKLQVDTRLKLLRCWDPRYSERVSHQHAGKIGLEALVAGDDEPASDA